MAKYRLVHTKEIFISPWGGSVQENEERIQTALCKTMTLTHTFKHFVTLWLRESWVIAVPTHFLKTRRTYINAFQGLPMTEVKTAVAVL